ncbi:MAG: hypothetical protein KYX68_08270 [Flavobacterium sp.]|nr:hypothetical protein [Flavobacterium sp.]
MKKLLFILFIILICSFNQEKKDCSIIGKYRIEYENKNIKTLNSKISFKDSTYTKSFELGEVKGNIKKFKDQNGKCIFYLYDEVNRNIDSTKLSNIKKNGIIDKIKTLGLPIMEFTEPLKDTIEFKVVYSGQLNVIIEKGILVKE